MSPAELDTKAVIATFQGENSLRQGQADPESGQYLASLITGL